MEYQTVLDSVVRLSPVFAVLIAWLYREIRRSAALENDIKACRERTRALFRHIADMPEEVATNGHD